MAGNLNDLMAIRMQVDDAANFDYTVTRGFEVVDMVCTTNATAGGAATITPQTPAGSSLGAAMTVTTTDLIVYASTLINAQATVPSGQVIRAIGSRADMDAFIYFYVIPTSWISG